MCIRFGSDEGRDFLSTSDPQQRDHRDRDAGKLRRTDQSESNRLQAFLEQFYFKGGERR